MGLGDPALGKAIDEKRSRWRTVKILRPDPECAKDPSSQPRRKILKKRIAQLAGT